MIKDNKKEKKGFSLIEVMMAIFLVSTGLVVIMSLLSMGIKNFVQNKNNLMASFLSQEGVELVRNIRDTNWVNGVSSFNGIGTGSGCRIDAYNFTSLSCGYSSFTLYYNSLVYRHSGTSSQKTKFSRKIIVENEAGGEQKIVTSVVIWGDRFPDNDDIDSEGCNSSTECAFSKISLTKWKEE